MNMDSSVGEGHLCNMGKMIEEMEGKLRNSLDQVSSSFLLAKVPTFFLLFSPSGPDKNCKIIGLAYELVHFTGLFWEDKGDGLHIEATT